MSKGEVDAFVHIESSSDVPAKWICFETTDPAESSGLSIYRRHCLTDAHSRALTALPSSLFSLLAAWLKRPA